MLSCNRVPARAASYQATGVKVGELTQTSAIVWTRATRSAERRADGKDFGLTRSWAFVKPLEEGTGVGDLVGACPGAEARVRVRYGTDKGQLTAETEWIRVTATSDFSHQFVLRDLKPATCYYYESQTSSAGDDTVDSSLAGSFRTAPSADVPAPVRFTAITGQMYSRRDLTNGFQIYRAMGDLKPHFIVPTGDTVYYDKDEPLANTVELARHHWHRIYSLPIVKAFHLNVPGYWEKDDHDTLWDDCWPGMSCPGIKPFTFEDGLRIFREQVPMGEKTYRTVRWGRDLQIWLMEGRDFRSSNRMKDGPDKTIWGKEQKQWLFGGLEASDAAWKIIISPTPIVGPDRGNKTDNHSNRSFAHEGNEVRSWLKANVASNCVIVCGDRHWQYHSVHPQTGLEEFSTGPTTDRHAGGFGRQHAMHKFFRKAGGFLSVEFSYEGGRPRLVFRHHDVTGKVMYEHKKERNNLNE